MLFLIAKTATFSDFEFYAKLGSTCGIRLLWKNSKHPLFYWTELHSSVNESLRYVYPPQLCYHWKGWKRKAKIKPLQYFKSGLVSFCSQNLHNWLYLQSEFLLAILKAIIPFHDFLKFSLNSYKRFCRGYINILKVLYWFFYHFIFFCFREYESYLDFKICCSF